MHIFTYFSDYIYLCIMLIFAYHLHVLHLKCMYIYVYRSDARRRARRRVAMGLELRGAGLLRGAFGSGSPAGPARLVTGSTFPGARPARLRGSRRSRQLGAGRGAGLRRWLLLSGSGPEGRGASRSAPRAGEADGDQDGRSVPPDSLWPRGPRPVLPSQG